MPGLVTIWTHSLHAWARDTRPAYFSSIACTVADNSGRPGLRSAECGDLFVPRTRTTRLGGQSFFIAAPVVWISLPFTLAPHPTVAVSFKHGSRIFSFHCLFLWELWRDRTEL